MQTSGRTKTDPAKGDEIATSEVVCLVDDDPSVRKSVGRLLESAGFDVRSFAEPKSFLDYLAQNPVPVAVLDVWMENMTGMELLAHLCARSPRTKIIFITGHEDPAAEATVTQAGVFAFFLKPFDDEQFLNKIHEAFVPPETEKEKAAQMSGGRDSTT